MRRHRGGASSPAHYVSNTLSNVEGKHRDETGITYNQKFQEMCMKGAFALFNLFTTLVLSLTVSSSTSGLLT